MCGDDYMRHRKTRAAFVEAAFVKKKKKEESRF